MNIAVFGATGRTGKQVVEQALERGYEVTAFARNPEKLGELRERIQVIQGDVQDKEKVSQAVAAADAVISVLGPTKNEPVFEVTRGTENILDAMEQHEVSRLVLSTGAGIGDPNDEPKLFHRVMNLLVKTFSRYIYEDMKRTVETVRGSSGDWTVVRVPVLTDDPATGEVKVGWVGKGMGPRISRADMAGFLLDQLEDDTYLRKAPAISN